MQANQFQHCKHGGYWVVICRSTRYEHYMETGSFVLRPVESLTASDFEESPLWAGYYEPDDIDEIVRWGVPEAVVRAALDSVSWEDDHYFPLPIAAAQTEWMRGKLYAVTAALPDGTELIGYVGEHQDYLVVFVSGRARVLSAPLPDLRDAMPLPIRVTNRVTGERWNFPVT